MHLKTCTKCKKAKSLDNFYLRKKGPRSGKYYERCKICMMDRGRSYYAKNRDRQLKLSLLRRAKYRKRIKNYLVQIKSKPCMDCGKIYPHFVMDFDHREDENKEKEIAKMVAGGWSKWKIDDEIKKCDLVCSNCHRIRTFANHAEIAKLVKAGA